MSAGRCIAFAIIFLMFHISVNATEAPRRRITISSPGAANRYALTCKTEDCGRVELAVYGSGTLKRIETLELACLRHVLENYEYRRNFILSDQKKWRIPVDRSAGNLNVLLPFLNAGSLCAALLHDAVELVEDPRRKPVRAAGELFRRLLGAEAGRDVDVVLSRAVFAQYESILARVRRHPTFGA